MDQGSHCDEDEWKGVFTDNQGRHYYQRGNEKNYDWIPRRDVHGKNYWENINPHPRAKGERSNSKNHPLTCIPEGSREEWKKRTDRITNEEHWFNVRTYAIRDDINIHPLDPKPVVEEIPYGEKWSERDGINTFIWIPKYKDPNDPFNPKYDGTFGVFKSNSSGKVHRPNHDDPFPKAFKSAIRNGKDRSASPDIAIKEPLHAPKDYPLYLMQDYYDKMDDAFKEHNIEPYEKLENPWPPPKET